MLSIPVPNRSIGSDGVARLEVADTEAPEKVSIALVLSVGDDVVDWKGQELDVLPRALDVHIDEPRYRLFALGIARALGHIPARFMPHDLLVVNLLRVSSLDTPENFAGAIVDWRKRGSALAAIEVADYAREKGVAPVDEPETSLDLWELMEGADGEAAEVERCARALVDRKRPESVPFLIRVVEDWSERMGRGHLWVDDDGRNVDVVVARILEPLLRATESETERKRVEALATSGIFDPDREKAQVE